MRAAVFHELGGPEVLRIEEWEKEAPGPGEVLIKVTSAGLNRADFLFQQGRYYRKPHFPSRTGKEAAGIVEAVGEGSSFLVGDRVAVLASTLHASSQGGIAEYVVAPDALVVKTPSTISDADAGGIWMQYLTAHGALNHVVTVQPGEHVVITAASSSVGLAAISLVNMLGGVSIATTTSPAKVDRLRELGARHVIDVTNEDYVDRIKKITGGAGAEVIFDAVTGAMMKQHVAAVKMFGWILFYGVLDTTPIHTNPGVLIGKNATLRAYSVGALYSDPAAIRKAVDAIGAGLENGMLSLTIDRHFPLDQVQDAFRYLLSNQQVGKIVVNP